MNALIALSLVLLGVFARLNPEHVDNLVPLGAIALYAGARLPRRWAFVVPMAIMLASDLALDLYYYPQYGRGPFDPTRLAVYGSYLAIVALGWSTCRRSMNPKQAPMGLAGVEAASKPLAAALVGSLLFFFVTNFATWAAGMSLRPMTAAGLVGCYVDAVPFYRTTLAAEVLGTIALFGVDALARRAWATRAAAAEAA